ncbi:MAG: peptidoglycan DD-metalloendopeptidase family protein [Prevotellaceae bacterium]|jgi:murein DD-endopeptidase MepM/ murein hydrolase activator NlpD|nr:peptidoglycan DD-metalloendopeptidase family protein [Prevotellaceae bacterium]
MSSIQKRITPTLVLVLISLTAFAEKKENIKKDIVGKDHIVLSEKDDASDYLILNNDTTSYYFEILNDFDDELPEEHPAHDIYNNIWADDRLNPYQTPYNQIQDSIYIDCSEFTLPVPGEVTSDFGRRRYRFHYGVDLRLKTGDNVLSAFSGKVRIIAYERRGYGHYVVIRHNNGLETVYGHLSKVLVKHDQVISAGDIIGLGGSTGRSTAPHLHFEMRYLGNAINPADVINFQNGGGLYNELYLITQEETFAYQQKVQQQLNSRQYYSVRKGDTLGRIASRNGTSVNNLCRLNNISSKSILSLGQRLRVK